MAAVTTSVQSWRRSGLAYLTGSPTGMPDSSRAAVLDEAQRVCDGIESRLGVTVDPVEILTGRAAQLGLSRHGRVSAGGATRLMRASDTWCAVTLSRPDDMDLVAALTEIDDPAADRWTLVERWVAQREAATVVERCVLLGMPASALGEASPADPVVRRAGPTIAPRHTLDDLLVVDLTSMWAGPLCGALLARAGATVVKVESPRRPDGTRSGTPSFFDAVNTGKLSYAVDLDAETVDLRRLLGVADVVLESSRPAALPRRGCGPADVPARAGRVWLRVTGHGTTGPAARRVAFGDDAAVAGGLVGLCEDGPVFCGDAIADPLTGLQATRSVLDALGRGGGAIVDVSMAATAARYASLPLADADADADADAGPCAAPRLPPVSAPGPPLGADTEAVRRLVAKRSEARC